MKGSSRRNTGALKDRQDNFRGCFAARSNAVSPDWEDLVQHSHISTSARIACKATMRSRGGTKHSPRRLRLTTPPPQSTIENDPMARHTLLITRCLLLVPCVDLPHVDALPGRYDLLSWILQRTVSRRTTARPFFIPSFVMYASFSQSLISQSAV